MVWYGMVWYGTVLLLCVCLEATYPLSALLFYCCFTVRAGFFSHRIADRRACLSCLAELCASGEDASRTASVALGTPSSAPSLESSTSWAAFFPPVRHHKGQARRQAVHASVDLTASRIVHYMNQD